MPLLRPIIIIIINILIMIKEGAVVGAATNDVGVAKDGSPKVPQLSFPLSKSTLPTRYVMLCYGAPSTHPPAP
jgi:hypothetical protein